MEDRLTQQKKILVVEDDEIVRDIMSSYFEDSDFVVIEANNGQVALEQLKKENPDIIITDLLMPIMDGYELIKSVTEENPEIPIVVVSAVGDVESALKAVRLGAWDYIHKPIGEFELLDHIIGKVLERSALLKSNKYYKEFLEEEVVKRTTQLEEELACRIHAEEELKKNEKKYRTIAENTNDIVYCLSADGTFTFVSPQIERYGYKQEELIGKPFAFLFSDDDAELCGKVLAQTLLSDRKSPSVMSLKSDAGNKIYIEEFARAIYSADGTVSQLVGVLRDITERKNTEDQLRLLKEKAEAANKFKSIFLANISHEIRTPMNSIIGFTDLLAKTSIDKVQKDYIDTIDYSSKHLLNIINDLLDISSIRAGAMTLESVETDLYSLLEDLFIMLRPQAEEKNIELRFNYSEQTPRFFEADPTRLRQIFLNLLNNGIKFTHQGYVEIAVSNLSDNSVQFKVKDTGIGIASTKQEHIFDAFMQSDESISSQYGGSGLGLSIVALLVDLMNGNIELKSEEGVGSEFWVRIPLCAIDRDREENVIGEINRFALPEKFKADIEKYNILIVEDDEVNTKLLNRLIKMFGCKADCASNGREAIEKISDSTYDLVLMDISMPIMDGITATKYIRNELKSDIPIIALTALLLEYDRQTCLDAGMNDFISKPIDIGVLRNVFIQWLSGKYK